MSSRLDQVVEKPFVFIMLTLVRICYAEFILIPVSGSCIQPMAVHLIVSGLFPFWRLKKLKLV